MAPYEVLNGRKYRSLVHRYETGPPTLDHPDFTRGTTEVVKLIRQRLEIAQRRKKSYENKRMRPQKFQVRGVVFLKVAPLKVVVRIEEVCAGSLPRDNSRAN